MTVISDNKIPFNQNQNTTFDATCKYSYLPDVVSVNDYYPFGMVMPGRSFGENYRFGFNGKENDNEVKGEGGQLDYGMRIYDPRVAKFLSVDPLSKKFSYYTPYQFSGNMPICAIDLDGLEEYVVIYWYNQGAYNGSTVVRINNESNRRYSDIGVVYVDLEDTQINRDRVATNRARGNVPADLIYNQTGSFNENINPIFSLDPINASDKSKFESAKTENLRRAQMERGEIEKAEFPGRYKVGEGTIDFDFDKSNLDATDIKTLDKVAVFLKENPLYSLEISGHASKPNQTGDVKYNDKISLNRANNVQNYLLNKGIEGDRLSVTSHGDSQASSNNEKSQKVVIGFIVPAKD